MHPRLDILPEPQRRLWPELRTVASHFVLYGGTAVSLRLAHRSSADFDLFSSLPFVPADLLANLTWLQGCERLQSKPNTLTVIARPTTDAVRISFFGGLKLGRVCESDLTGDGVLRIASPLDLAATKVAVIQQRAEKKDYQDIAALLQAGIALPDALGAACALYGDTFNPMISLKALSYFKDGDLPELPIECQSLLSKAAGAVTTLPRIRRVSDNIA
jgi:hypothetical protein